MKTQNKSVRMGWVAFAAVSAMVAGVSQADVGVGNVPTKAVVYKDLNLKSDAGIQVLYRRIEGAADQSHGTVGMGAGSSLVSSFSAINAEPEAVSTNTT